MIPRICEDFVGIFKHVKEFICSRRIGGEVFVLISLTNSSHMWRFGTTSSYMWRIGTNSSHMRRIGMISSDVRRMLPNHISEELVPTLTSHVWVIIAHVKISSTNYGFCVNDWTRMHFREGGEGGGFGINVRNTHNCYMKLFVCFIWFFKYNQQSFS